MRHRYAILAARLLSLFGLFAGAAIHAYGANSLADAINARIASERFSGAILVADGDQIIFDKGYGSANLEWNVPNSPKTRFRIGSITKQFTAASIMLLKERGKLRIEDPISTYLSATPQAWSSIKI
jgi:CubicO group peptidase (beta-lactamase class C family)